MHPRLVVGKRSNRLLHHRIGIGFVGERARAVSATPSQSLRQGLPLGARVTTALARPPPRYDACTGGCRNPLFQERSIRTLHHRQTCKLSFVSMTKASERRKQKPLRSNQLGRGSKDRTRWNGSDHSTSARKRAHLIGAANRWLACVESRLNE